MKKILIAVSAMLALGLTAAGPALANSCADYNFCSQGAGAAGDGRTFQFFYNGGEGEPGGEFSVDVLSTPRHLGTFRFDSNGNFNIVVRIPNDVPAGSHTLRAVGRSRFGGQLTVTAAITVTGRRSGGGGLTPTGTPVLPLGLAGLGTILIGGTAVGVAHRRNRKQAA